MRWSGTPIARSYCSLTWILAGCEIEPVMDTGSISHRSLLSFQPRLVYWRSGRQVWSARASGSEGALRYQLLRYISGSGRAGHRGFPWLRYTLVYRNRRGRGSDLVSVGLGSLLRTGPTGSPYFTGLGGGRLCPLHSGRGRLNAGLGKQGHWVRTSNGTDRISSRTPCAYCHHRPHNSC